MQRATASQYREIHNPDLANTSFKKLAPRLQNRITVISGPN